MEIEALNENIGRWETTWFTFIYYIYSVLIWWGTTSIKALQKSSLKNLLLTHNLSFNGVLISNDKRKTKMTLNLEFNCYWRFISGCFSSPS